jgi:mannosyltransferase
MGSPGAESAETSRFWRAFPFALTLVALVMRVVGRADSGLWYDEIQTLVDFARLPLAELLTTYGDDNNHPLYSLCAWFSLHLLGDGAFALRLPAILFGAASVPMLWALARRVSPREQALLATTLLLISYHHVWFSQNARGYTMLLFFTLASTHFFLRILEVTRRGDLVGYVLCMALGTYAHSSAVFVAFAHGIVALSSLRISASKRLRVAPLGAVALAAVASLILHTAILADMLEFFAPSGGGVDTSGASEWTAPWWTLRRNWTSPWWMLKEVASSPGVGLGPGLVVVGGAVLVLALGTAGFVRQDWRLAALFLLPGLIGAAVILGLGLNLWPRFFFNLQGFFLLIAVRGVFLWVGWMAGRLDPERWPRARSVMLTMASITLVAASLVVLPRAYLLPKQDFEGARAFVDTVRGEQDVVLVAGLTVMPYTRYFETDFVEVSTPSELDAQVARHRTAYLLQTLPALLESGQPELAAAVEDRGVELARFAGSLGGGDVVVYRIQSQAEARDRAKP